MLCNIKPVPFHESDKHIFAKIPVGVRTPGPPPLDPPMIPDQRISGSYSRKSTINYRNRRKYQKIRINDERN